MLLLLLNAGRLAAGPRVLEGAAWALGSAAAVGAAALRDPAAALPASAVWPVDYESATCSGQKHLRLTSGWQQFSVQKQLDVGG
jgi:hypothetical protein